LYRKQYNNLYNFVFQTEKQLKMKKVTIAMLAAGAVLLASCGGNADADKAKAAADSARVADSLAQVEAAAKAQAAADSARMADSLAAVAAAAEAEAAASKTKGGKSSGGGSKPKTEAPKTEEPVKGGSTGVTKGGSSMGGSDKKTETPAGGGKVTKGGKPL
jgi:hypothetical protein